MEKTKNTELKKDTMRKGAVLLFLIVVFAGIFFVGGVNTYPDTESYLKMSPIREPGYALLLNGMRALFGEKAFWVLGFLQNALAVAAVYVTSAYIGRKCEKKYIWYVAVLCMLLPYVVTPFFASSGIILTNAMISEGITLSLYNLYFLFLLQAVWEKENRGRHLFFALVIGFLLSITRGQMLVTLIAWVIVAVVLYASGKEFRRVCKVVIAFLLVLECRVVCVNGYNLLANGVYTGTAYGDVTILSNVIYVADRSDGENIREEKLRRLFYEIYDIAEKGQMTIQYAPADFTGEAGFYSDMHDDIKDFGIFPVLQSYAEKEEGITDYTEKLMRVDELASGITKDLLPQCFGDWVCHYFRNAAVGLIRTVAFVHPLFNIPAFVGYGILIGMGIFVYRKKKFSKGVGMLLLTALLTAGNVAAVAVTIMCLSRYMIYNMAFVYITAILLFTELLNRKKEDK